MASSKKDDRGARVILIGDAEPITQAGIKQVVKVPAWAPPVLAYAQVGNPAPYVVDLLRWETAGNDPQELEVMIWPLALNYPLDRVATFASVLIDLAWGVGGGGGGVEYSTMHARAEDPAFERSSSRLPDHGIKFRLSCRSASLKLQCYGPGNTFLICATFQAAIGGNVTPPFPTVAYLSIDGEPLPIPIGASEFRVSQGNPYTRLGLSHWDGAGTSIFVGDCFDWTAIPGDAVMIGMPVGESVIPRQAFCTVCFR